MKKLMEFCFQFEFVWSAFFTSAIIIYASVAMFLGEGSMTYAVIWQLIIVTHMVTVIYYAVFAEFIFNSLSTKYRILIHFPLCFIILIASVYIFKWFDILNLYYTGIFTLGYIILYLSSCWSLDIYYKATGDKLNDKLAIYKQKRKLD